jgi:hypothetical protein
MLLTHPLTHMGRVSMLAAHFIALSQGMSSMFTLCLTAQNEQQSRDEGALGKWDCAALSWINDITKGEGLKEI